MKSLSSPPPSVFPSSSSYSSCYSSICIIFLPLTWLLFVVIVYLLFFLTMLLSFIINSSLLRSCEQWTIRFGCCCCCCCFVFVFVFFMLTKWLYMQYRRKRLPQLFMVKSMRYTSTNYVSATRYEYHIMVSMVILRFQMHNLILYEAQ